MLYRFAIVVLKFVLFFIFRIKVLGVENIPKSGSGGILAVNHRSNWDVIISGTMCPRMLRFMAKAELFENKIIGALLKNLGAFPVQRGKGDVGAIKSALSKLKANHIILMFPEGRRIRNEKDIVTDAKAGIAMLATRAQVPVIPAYISGEYKWLHKITIVFGKPITYEEYYGQKLTMEQLQEMSNDVLKTLRTLKIEKK